MNRLVFRVSVILATYGQYVSQYYKVDGIKMIDKPETLFFHV